MGEGVEERVSGQASAAVGGTGLLYQRAGSPHPNLHAQRGARNCHSSGRPVEGVWKKLKGDVFTEAPERNVDMTSPLETDPMLGQGWRCDSVPRRAVGE